MEAVLLGAVVDGHLAALAQVAGGGKALVGELEHGEAAPQQDARLAVLRW